MSFMGNIVSLKMRSLDLHSVTDRDSRARAMAKAFLEDEAELLGLTNTGEVRERRIITKKVSYGIITDIEFRRYVNGIEVKNAYILLIIGPEEQVDSIMTELVPVTPEMYQAASEKSISKEQVDAIVNNDLRSSGVPEKEAACAKSLLSTKYSDLLKQYLITTPPYIVWKTSCYYNYVINAITGEIISKEPAASILTK